MTTGRRIGVNLTWCRPGRVGGSEEYLARQLMGLSAAAPSEFDVTIFAPSGFAEAHRELANRYPIDETRSDGSSRARRIVNESTWLRRRTAGSALVHHGGGTLPVAHRSPTLLTIHDLQYRQFPQYFGGARLAYLRSVMPRSARNATAIAVPTNFVRDTVCDAYDIDGTKVHVVPHGVPSDLGSHRTPESDVRAKHRLGDAPFVLLPAMTHPHKGHRFLLDVFERFGEALGVRLVLIGGAGSIDEEVARRADRLAGLVSKLGRVSDSDRDGLISAAAAVVFPSEYEGFGAPLIEAMVLGTPVISSDRACLPEVVGSAGIVAPLDVDSWREAIGDVDRRRAELVTAGRNRVRDFTVEVSGSALATAYRSLLDVDGVGS